MLKSASSHSVRPVFRCFNAVVMSGVRLPALCFLLCVVISWRHGIFAAAADCQGSDGVVNLVVSEVSPSWVLLEWQHSPTAATCADHYSVSWCVLPAQWSSQCESSSQDLPLAATSYNVSGLKPCSFHRLAVSTVGKDGVRDQATELVITPAQDLGPVQNLEASQSGEKLTLIWDAPEGSEACTARYEVCWRLQGGDDTCSWTGINLWLGGDVAPQPCSSYVFSVTAYDVANTSSSQANTSYGSGAGRMLNLTASEVTPHSVLLAWQSSSPNSSCEAGYAMTWCPADSYSGLCLQPAVTLNLTRGHTQYNLTGLRPCHLHRVSIVVRADDGSASDDVTITVKTSLAELRPPQNVSVEVVNSQLTFVDFVPAEDSGLCTSRYTGCLREDDDPGAKAVCLPAANDQYWATWDDHTKPCTNYTLQLNAYSADNATVNTSVSFTAGAADASALRASNVTSNGTEVSASLTWEVTDLNSKCVRYQQVSWTAVGRNLSFSVDVSTSTRQLLMEDLQPCSEYEVGVQQKSAGPSSITTLQFRSASNVTSVRDLEASRSTPDTVTVSFFAPEASTSCVTNYSVCSRRTDGDRQRRCGALTTSGRSYVDVSFLQPCTNYTVHVAPLGPDGRPYDWSSVVAATTGCQSCAAIMSAANTVACVLLLGAVTYLHVTHL